MILNLCIIGLVISVVGIFKKVKGAIVSCIIWALAGVNLLLELSVLRGTLTSSIIGGIALIVQIIWMVIINKVMGEVWYVNTFSDRFYKVCCLNSLGLI